MRPATERAVRLLGVVLLAAAACGNLVGGLAAAEHYAGRKLYGWLEGDWFFLFGLIGAGACLAIALDNLSKVLGRE